MESRFQKKEGFCIFGVKGKIRFMKKEEMENLKGLDLKELINLGSRLAEWVFSQQF